MAGAELTAPAHSRDPARGRRLAAARAAVRAVPRPLVALLVAATVLSVAWAVFTAPFDGPDEIGHAAYVQQLAETGDGPQGGATSRGRDLSSEGRALLFWANLDALARNDATRPAWSPAELHQYRRASRGAARDDG